ncbi:MAG: hypothetical protein BWY66_02769 [bacterium ADurb.Bin374]|nr:MAG: hypothetical protein BWY66_02769 [bacterium ADurb.Bin374]
MQRAVIRNGRIEKVIHPIFTDWKGRECPVIRCPVDRIRGVSVHLDPDRNGLTRRHDVHFGRLEGDLRFRDGENLVSLNGFGVPYFHLRDRTVGNEIRSIQRQGFSGHGSPGAQVHEFGLYGDRDARDAVELILGAVDGHIEDPRLRLRRQLDPEVPAGGRIPKNRAIETVQTNSVRCPDEMEVPSIQGDDAVRF